MEILQSRRPRFRYGKLDVQPMILRDDEDNNTDTFTVFREAKQLRLRHRIRSDLYLNPFNDQDDSNENTVICPANDTTENSKPCPTCDRIAYHRHDDLTEAVP